VIELRSRPQAPTSTLLLRAYVDRLVAGGRVVFATLLSETHGRLLAFLQNMAFYDAAAVGDAIAYVNRRLADEEG